MGQVSVPHIMRLLQDVGRDIGRLSATRDLKPPGPLPDMCVCVCCVWNGAALAAAGRVRPSQQAWHLLGGKTKSPHRLYPTARNLRTKSLPLLLFVPLRRRRKPKMMMSKSFQMNKI